ncbi:hypothetical protein [Nonomuraea cavernae]|uniref:hypothetical protein n=1 Tax=Nonomuraea cavernae TaxID=2045107 RepID=UPI0033EACB2F
MTDQAGMSMAFDAAQRGCGEMTRSVQGYAGAATGLRTGLEACGGGTQQDPELVVLLAEFTGLLSQAADRSAQVYAATADGMADTVTAVRQAEAASAAQVDAAQVHAKGAT